MQKGGVSMEDETLVRAFRAGNTGAFGQLYERYKSQVLRTAFLIVGNHCDSENVLQDSFIKVWQNLPGLKDPACFRPWLWRIVTRTAWEYCRRRDVEQPVEAVWDVCRMSEEQAQSSLDVIMQAENHKALLGAINELDLKQRTVIILYYYNELSVQEIAAATGALPGTIKSRLWAARRKLRRTLTAGEYFNGEVEPNETRSHA
ncbi:MAG: RNA polymerase sigma factor [Firmicutes bacterium]|nr:RNA polymerase sigma factor [Bacillota bacterium]